MSCPNCGQPMYSRDLDNQHIYHCSKCGGSFFEENSINRISLQVAQSLHDDRASDEISAREKYCPKDNQPFTALPPSQNIPEGTTLLSCPRCRGIFAYPDDLLHFKQAQEAKVNYFKLWQFPLPSIQSVAILGVVFVISLSLFTLFFYGQPANISRTNAQDLVKNVYITHSDRYLFISYKTTVPLKSTIIFSDQTIGQQTVKIVDDTLQTLHQLTTGDVNIVDLIYYQIILIDSAGNQTKTTPTRLNLQK